MSDEHNTDTGDQTSANGPESVVSDLRRVGCWLVANPLSSLLLVVAAIGAVSMFRSGWNLLIVIALVIGAFVIAGIRPRPTRASKG